LEKEKVPYLGIDTSKEAVEICRKKELNCKQSTIEQLIKSITNKHNDSGVVVPQSGTPPQNDARLAEATAKRVILATPTSSRRRPESKGNSRQNLNKLKFDAVTMFQVIEHLKNPLPLFQSAKKLLKKNGVILLTTPNNDSPLRKIFASSWSVYNEPSHFIFFNKTTLRKTLQMAGWEDINVINDNPRYLSLSYILNRLNLKSSNISHLTSNIAIPTDPFGDLEATATMNYD